jgi:hypothetical protein
MSEQTTGHRVIGVTGPRGFVAGHLIRTLKADDDVEVLPCPRESFDFDNELQRLAAAHCVCLVDPTQSGQLLWQVEEIRGGAIRGMGEARSGSPGHESDHPQCFRTWLPTILQLGGCDLLLSARAW